MARRFGFNARDPNVLTRIVDKLREWVGEGRDEDLAVVTRKDLRDIFQQRGPRNLGPAFRQAVDNLSPASPADEAYNNAEVPNKPTGVELTETIGALVVEFDDPDYNGHARTEVHRSTTSAINDATRVSSNVNVMYWDDDAAGGTEYYYWLRHINLRGEEGPFSDVVSGTAKEDPDVLLDRLTGEITESQLYQGLNDRLDNIENNSAEIEERVRTKVDGNEVTAQYDMRLQTTVNGDVVMGGFGLAADGDTVQAGFNVDRFWIGHPDTDYSQEDKNFPFIVDNGAVFMDEVFIREAAIGTALIGEEAVENSKIKDGAVGETELADASVSNLKIKDTIESDDFLSGFSGWKIDKSGSAEFNDNLTVNATAIIDTLQVEDGAITNSVSAYAGSRKTTTTMEKVLEASLSFDGSQAFVMATAHIPFHDISNGSFRAKLYVDGIVVFEYDSGNKEFATGTVTLVRAGVPDSGYTTIELHMSNVEVEDRAIYAVETKK